MKKILSPPLQLHSMVLFVLLLFTSTLHAQLTVNVTGVVQPCYNDGQATATITSGTPPYTVEWSKLYPAPTVVSTATTATGLGPGVYWVTVTDATSATATDSIYLYPPFNISMSASGASCPMTNGSATATVWGTVTPPFDFLWSNGVNNTGVTSASNTITGIGVGQYDCIIIDGSGCGYSTSDFSSGAYVYNTTPITLSFSKTPSDCFDGTATALPGTGTAPYSYMWQTTPVQTTATATGLSPGYHQVTVTDGNGCTGSGTVYVDATSSYPVATSVFTNNICPATTSGAIDLTVTGGVGSLTYSWNTGATTQDISSLTSGAYTVNITDATGCTISHTQYINTVSTVHANVSTTGLVGCMPATGTAAATATGGTGTYIYEWSNGATTATISGLDAGYYVVTATDANGCSDGDYGIIDYDPGCYFHINGKVVNDQNGNCTEDGLDTRLPYQVISVSPGYWATTNQYGVYGLQSVEYGTYNLNYNPPPSWNLVCPATPYTFTTTAGSTYTADYYAQPSSFTNDLQSYVSCGTATPGFIQTNWITITNTGTTTLSGTLQVEHDADVSFYSSIPTATAYNAAAHLLSFSFFNLGPYQTKTFKVENMVSATTPLNTPVGLRARIVPLVGETDTLNNSDTCHVLVSGAYDPNIKEVEPAGVGLPGYIASSNNVMDYTIRFQNTGTDTAHNIQIRDTLDQDLDLSSFQLTGSSFPVVWNISGPGVLTFTFNNIELPDSTRDEPGSHGMVSYRLRHKPGLAEGTEITNTAYIYFDFNMPIVTNTVLNTINNSLSVSEQESAQWQVSVYPNPAQTQVHFRTNAPDADRIVVFDLTGRTAGMAITNGGGYTFNAGQVENGVYTYLVLDKAGKQLHAGKFVVQH